jgi:broad specificity phosphatase PhoE
MRIYFARHGQSEANVQRIISNRDLPHRLTALGRQQAAELAERLVGAGLTVLYTSPVPRALETAEILSARLGLPFQLTEALREYDCGIIEGKSDPESWRLHKKLHDDWLIRRQWDSFISGGERFEDIRRRFVPFIRKLCDPALPAERNILLVGHGGLYQCMLPLVLTNIQFAWAARQPIPNTAYILGEQHANELVCVDWCGNRLSVPENQENTV